MTVHLHRLAIEFFFQELRSANPGESIEEASAPRADNSTLAHPLPPICSPFKFSESDERHSCFDSSPKRTAHLPAVWIGVANRTKSLSELSACSGSGRSGPSASGRGIAW